MLISIAKDFSPHPGGRSIDSGKHSAEEFYVTLLKPTLDRCIAHNELLHVNMDGTAGFAGSFIDEAFGRLVLDYSLDAIAEYLYIISEEMPEYKYEVWQSVNEWNLEGIPDNSPLKK